jgi:hypothetical protein
MLSRCSTIFPSRSRTMSTYVSLTGLPLGGMSQRFLVWVPVSVFFVTTRSPSAIMSSISQCPSGNASKNDHRNALPRSRSFRHARRSAQVDEVGRVQLVEGRFVLVVLHLLDEAANDGLVALDVTHLHLLG